MDDYGEECGDKVAELEARVGNLEHALLAQRKVESNLRQMLDVARKDNKAGRLEKEVEALRAQLAETERNLTRANARLMQWESGEKERVGAHVLKADLQKRLAAAERERDEARAEVAALRAQVPPAEVVDEFRRLTRTQAGWAGWKALTAWLATLPTQEAQP